LIQEKEKIVQVITMNNASPTQATTLAAALQNPQIIRINCPRPLIDRKPDDEASRIVISGAQSASSSSATVPQIVSILSQGVAVTNAKKCTFHQQCLHIQSPQSQQPGQPQTTAHLIQHQIQLPLQTPPQLLHHPQQQLRISNSKIPNNSTSVAGSVAVNRTSAQANRDAISTNITPPPMNAALLQDRYLLLDLVDGSSFYKCIDIQTQKMLVCKVSLIFDCVRSG
jgi:hypothetical protein